MTPAHLKATLADPAAIATLCPSPSSLACLPLFLKPFQARWLLNCTDKELSIIRELHPELVARRNGRGQFIYSRTALFQYAHINQ